MTSRSWNAQSRPPRRTGRLLEELGALVDVAGCHEARERVLGGADGLPHAGLAVLEVRAGGDANRRARGLEFLWVRRLRVFFSSPRSCTSAIDPVLLGHRGRK